MTPWWMLTAIALLLGAIAVAVAAARATRRGSDSAVVTTALTLAVITAVIAAVGGVVALLSSLLAPSVPISIPVQDYWPVLPAGAEIQGPSATRVDGGFRTAEIVAAGLSMGARVCWGISQAVAWLVPGTVATLVAITCAQLRAGRPFAPVLARLTMFVAGAVALGGTCAQVLGDTAGSMAAQELLAVTGWTSPEDLSALLPQPALLITFPFWPIGAGLALAALATLLRRGQALQRDTEGLV